MFVAKVELNSEWREMSECNTGEEFLIQNLNSPCKYIVKASTPTPEDEGGLLPYMAQLDFKMVEGKLYMKSAFLDGVYDVSIERVE